MFARIAANAWSSAPGAPNPPRDNAAQLVDRGVVADAAEVVGSGGYDAAVRCANRGEAIVRIHDGTTPDRLWSVADHADAVVTIYDAQHRTGAIVCFDHAVEEQISEDLATLLLKFPTVRQGRDLLRVNVIAPSATPEGDSRIGLAVHTAIRMTAATRAIHLVPGTGRCDAGTLCGAVLHLENGKVETFSLETGEQARAMPATHELCYRAMLSHSRVSDSPGMPLTTVSLHSETGSRLIDCGHVLESAEVLSAKEREMLDAGFSSACGGRSWGFGQCGEVIATVYCAQEQSGMVRAVEDTPRSISAVVAEIESVFREHAPWRSTEASSRRIHLIGARSPADDDYSLLRTIEQALGERNLRCETHELVCADVYEECCGAVLDWRDGTLHYFSHSIDANSPRPATGYDPYGNLSGAYRGDFPSARDPGPRQRWPQRSALPAHFCAPRPPAPATGDRAVAVDQRPGVWEAYKGGVVNSLGYLTVLVVYSHLPKLIQALGDLAGAWNPSDQACQRPCSQLD